MNNAQAVATSFFTDRSEKSFNEYYRTYSPTMKTICYNILKDKEYAEEVVNDIFMKMKNSTTFVYDETKSHKSYLGIMASCYAKIFYKNKKRDRLVSISSLSKDEENSPTIDSITDRINWFEDHITYSLVSENPLAVSEMLMILDTLPMTMEMGMIKDMLSGISHEEIMTKNGIESTVEYKSIISKARKRMVRIMKNTESMNSHKMKVEGSRNMADIVDDNPYDIKFKRIKKIVEDMCSEEPEYINGEGVLIDAMLNRLSYSKIKEKYNLGSVGVIKTRVCRAKNRILEILSKDMDEPTQKDVVGVSGLTRSSRIFFDDEVTLKAEYSIINGELHGQVKKYHRNGSLASVYNYHMGFKHGAFQEFDKDGTLAATGMYNMGEKSGVWDIFDENGRTMSSEYIDGVMSFVTTYENGVVVHTEIMNGEI